MRQIFILLTLFSALSCKQRSESSINIVKVDPSITDSKGISEIASGIERIILETRESCLITRIQGIKKTDQYIFVNDTGRRILQFDTSGKFIKQIGNEGRGPGEYSVISSIAIDSTNNTIYLSSGTKILCFDFSGKFLNMIKQEFISEFVIVASNKLWTISTSVGGKTINNSFLNITKLIRYTLEGNAYDTIIINKVRVSGFSGTLNQQAYYISDLGSNHYLYFPVMLSEPFLRDTLYEVKESTLIPSLKIDFGEAAEFINGKKQISIYDVFKTENYLFIDYTFNRRKNIYCFDRIRNIDFNLEKGFIDDYYNTGIVQLKPLDLKNETLYFSKEALDLSNIIKEVTENSNPVIFIVKLKTNLLDES